MHIFRTSSLVMTALATAAVLGAASCTSSHASSPSVFESAGPYPVGHSTILVADTAHGRVLPTEVWYPAAESARAAAEAGEPIEDFVTDSTDHATFAALLPTANNPGTRRQTSAARDVPLAVSSALFPVVAFSHCHECVRFSSFSIAERLASFGFVVVAPDHLTGTLFDGLNGTLSGLTPPFLETRRQDISAVLDAVLDPSGTTLPVQLRGILDSSRVGVFGHSFGAITTGLALKEDSRVKAGVALAAPVANPLFPAVTMGDIQKPLFMLLATEDNSIGTAGNTFIESNFSDATSPVWLASLADAGHMSVTDICGVTSSFGMGCISPATRQTNGKSFNYLDIEEARGITATYVTAFFALELQGDARAEKVLSPGHLGAATLRRRN